jgi:serine/threonine protein kinase
MEYLELGDLQNYMDDNDRLVEASVGHVIAQIVEGLSFMHVNGFAHRDMKPNVSLQPILSLVGIH